jgi:hypothetical protein
VYGETGKTSQSDNTRKELLQELLNPNFVEQVNVVKQVAIVK